MHPSWRFREKQPAEVHQDPANTEFFAQQDVADRLVREAAQNTIDAVRDGQTARLVFTLTAVHESYWDRYFGSLWPHLEAQSELLAALPSRRGPTPCLLVEDFGTTGLTGPLEPDDRRAAEQDEKNHRLFWFFKNVGRTSKTGDQLGSFGIGKTVFPYSSRINSFFGYSVREAVENEASIVLLGQSQLREHRLNGSRDLDPFGFFAWDLGTGANYVQRAVTEPPLLDEFRTAFGLRRVNDEPGLSVVIPYPAARLTRSDLAKSVIAQFFLPILTGELIVEIHEGHEKPAVLSSATLLDAIDQFEWANEDPERLRRHVRLAIWALGDGKRQIVELARPQSPTQPKFAESMFDPAARKELSQQFISGKPLAIRAPVPVEPKSDSQIVWSHIDLFLEYERGGTTKEDVYVRKGLTLIEHTGQARQAGLRAILIAQDRPVYEMLRSSENVAHTKWRQRGADKLNRQYSRGSAKVGYVLGVLPALVQALLSPDDEADWWTLADLFPESEPSPLHDEATEPSEEKPVSGPSRKGASTEDEPLEINLPPGPSRPWRARPMPNGLRVEANPSYAGPLCPLEFAAAYGLLNRSGLRAHNPADFSFLENPGMFEAFGASVRAVDHNRLAISPVSREFRIEVRGFDPRRALDYQIRTSATSSSAEED